MVPLTTGFTQENELHPAAKSLLIELFDKGFRDPTKVHRASRELSILVNKAKTTFAENLDADISQIEFLGEPDLGFQIGIEGMVAGSRGDSTEFNKLKRLKIAHSQIDRQPIHAIGRSLAKTNNQVEILPVEENGRIKLSNFEPDILIWQVANGETGNIQNEPKSAAHLFLDCTTSGVDVSRPKNGDVALFDSTAWAGPAGLGVLIIKKPESWKYPLAHIDAIRTPRTFSIPLMIASAVALENYRQELSSTSLKAKQQSEKLVSLLKNEIKDLICASDLENRQFKYLSLIIPNIDGEQLKNELAEMAIDIDSGSACKSADLRPSHVLAAMGLPTSGNIRITFKSSHTEKDLETLAAAIIKKVKVLRN